MLLNILRPTFHAAMVLTGPMIKAAFPVIHSAKPAQDLPITNAILATSLIISTLIIPLALRPAPSLLFPQKLKPQILAEEFAPSGGFTSKTTEIA